MGIIGHRLNASTLLFLSVLDHSIPYLEAFSCHPERNEGLSQWEQRCFAAFSMTVRPDYRRGSQGALSSIHYDALTTTSSTKKADVAELEDVVALKASVTVCPA